MVGSVSGMKYFIETIMTMSFLKNAIDLFKNRLEIVQSGGRN